MCANQGNCIWKGAGATWLYGKLLVALLVEKTLRHAAALSPWGFENQVSAHGSLSIVTGDAQRRWQSKVLVQTRLAREHGDDSTEIVSGSA